LNVGITGHQELEDPVWVEKQLQRIVSLQPKPLFGISSLAVGADQIFAQVVLDCGGELQVIIPCKGYADAFDEQGRYEYERLLTAASSVKTISLSVSDEEAYLAAGKRVVDISDQLIAVWDGLPAAGLGGTADIVAYAQSTGKGYFHINPVSHQATYIHATPK
jgi:hypothetical protein